MNNIKNIMLLSALVCGTAYAQDSYDAHTFTSSDLNGTARFVAMGGALGALGGDLSVAGTNPAGIAMFRSNEAAITASGLFAGSGAMNHDGSRMSLDQGGLVISFDLDNPSSKGLQYVNFGVNLNKKNNYLFNQKTNVQNIGGFYNVSQTYQIAALANFCWYDESWGMLADMSAETDNREGILSYDDEGYYDGIKADAAYYEKATFGSKMQGDVNLSFNFSDQVFLGLSMGVYDMDYNRESFYTELNTDGDVYDFTNWYKTKGDGFDVKLGAIVRPIEDSPFRIGFHVHTPIWYRMTNANGSELYKNDKHLITESAGEFDYKYHTPWKFGVSLGHTIGNKVALGAEYEYEDMSTSKYSDIDNIYSSYFNGVNSFTKSVLRGQHTLKVGAEFKPANNFAVRLGYNFVSSPFKSDAFRPVAYDGYSTETDFTNWKAMNRFCVGLGYRYKGGYIDIAYQYQSQNGDFYAFDNYVENDPSQSLKPTKINNNRSQIMATFGFKF